MRRDERQGVGASHSKPKCPPRPQRGRPEQPRRPVSRVDTSSEDQILIDVPGLVSEDLFGAVQAQLEENRQRRRDRPGGGRYLLQGLVVCKRCGYGCYGKPTSRAASKGKAGSLRLLPLHGLRRLSLRRPASLLEQADPHRYAGRRRLGRRASPLVRAGAGSGGVRATTPGCRDGAESGGGASRQDW